MNLLLDTSTFLWIVWSPQRLSRTAMSACADVVNKRYLSYVSVWEMIIKYKIGNMPFSHPPSQWLEEVCQKHLIRILPLTIKDFFVLETLPQLHRDPFDRLLIAQTIAEEMHFVTSDEKIKNYSVNIIW